MAPLAPLHEERLAFVRPKRVPSKFNQRASMLVDGALLTWALGGANVVAGLSVFVCKADEGVAGDVIVYTSTTWRTVRRCRRNDSVMRSTSVARVYAVETMFCPG